jgi:hypothetical protein
VFVLLLASKLGCVGCAARVALVLVMLALTVLWIRSEEPTGRAAHGVWWALGKIHKESPWFRQTIYIFPNAIYTIFINKCL